MRYETCFILKTFKQLKAHFLCLESEISALITNQREKGSSSRSTIYYRESNGELCTCREAGERSAGAAPLVVQSRLALLQIQPDQLQDQPVTLCDHLLWKLDPHPT